MTPPTALFTVKNTFFKKLLDFMHFGSPTLQHAVIRFPVPPPKGFPECCGLCSFITFSDGHLATAVEARFQRTTAQRQKGSYTD